MSYCVNCGVELNPGAERCPLCQTPAWHPENETPGEPYFATARPNVERAPRRTLAMILSSMLLSVVICCGLLNLLYIPNEAWSLYIIGAAMLLWIWFVLPLVVRWPTFLKLTADVAAVGLYVYLISISVHGADWFSGLALPLLVYLVALVFLLSFLLRGGRHSRLTTMSLAIGFLGLLLLGLEYFGDLLHRRLGPRLVADHLGHQCRAHHPPADHPTRPRPPRGDSQTLQLIKKKSA